MTKYQDVRNEVVLKLGGTCVSCGCDDIRVLELSHVNDDGRWRQRRAKSTGGFTLPELRSILDGSLDEELEVLCANCHTLRTKGYL